MLQACFCLLFASLKLALARFACFCCLRHACLSSNIAGAVKLSTREHLHPGTSFRHRGTSTCSGARRSENSRYIHWMKVSSNTLAAPFIASMGHAEGSWGRRFEWCSMKGSNVPQSALRDSLLFQQLTGVTSNTL